MRQSLIFLQIIIFFFLQQNQHAHLFVHTLLYYFLFAIKIHILLEKLVTVFEPPHDKTKWHVHPAKTQISLGEWWLCHEAAHFNVTYHRKVVVLTFLNNAHYTLSCFKISELIPKGF